MVCLVEYVSWECVLSVEANFVPQLPAPPLRSILPTSVQLGIMAVPYLTKFDVRGVRCADKR